MRELPTGTVTLLFTDIEGSTRLLQQLGECYASVLEECRTLLRTVFLESHGHEVDTQGDSFFVVFARATDALAAAVSMQRALAARAWPDGVMTLMRMGLHTGEPLRTAEGYVGLDVYHAARILSAGHGGQVLLSQTTYDLVAYGLPEGVGLRDLGEYRLKDLQHPSRLYQLVIADIPADFPPLNTLDYYPHNLPVQPTPFIGREHAVAAVQNLLQREDVRLLTLTGPGGIGKTRLGLQVAAELSDTFPDGVYFVNLAPFKDPESVLPTIAQAFDVKEAANQTLFDLLSALLREKQLLLLLDNFEQVVDAAPSVAALLAACPKLKMLVTSRATLHVQAEQEFAVSPLTLPDLRHLPDLVQLSEYEAVALFFQRAQAVKPMFQATNVDAPAVAEICVRLDGLPLAIELAAARIKLLPPTALLARLGQRLQILTSGARDVPARQQTLRNTLAWSYHLLDASEQRLFRLLSVFVGGCTLEAVEAISHALGDSPADVLDKVASLIDKSLLQQTEIQGEKPRIIMLETIREYGSEMLVASGDMETSHQAHAAYYLELVESAELELRGPQQVEQLTKLEQEYDNMRAALVWLLERDEARNAMELALRLGGALWGFWSLSARWREGGTFLQRALAASEGVVPLVRAKALLAFASITAVLGNDVQAVPLAEEALALYREQDDKHGIMDSLQALMIMLWKGNDPVRARTLGEEVLKLSREIGELTMRAWILFNLAILATLGGEYIRARTMFEESMTLHREQGDTRGVSLVSFRLAWLSFLSQGTDPIIHSAFKETLARARKQGDLQLEAESLHLLGSVLLAEGDPAGARALTVESLALYREIGMLSVEDKLFALLGDIEAYQGNNAAAQVRYEESLALAQQLGDKLCIVNGLEGLAGIIAAQGETAWAARLWGAAESLREVIGAPLPPVYQAAYDRSISAARSSLGEKAFTSAWAEGRMMTPEQALSAQDPATILSPPPTAPPSTKPSPTYPNGLTAREVEVLRLLTHGLTDEQIADQLFISPRTVNSHLTSIYSKIQVSARAAATRYAIEHQLV